MFAAQDRPGVLVNQNPFARRIKKAMAVAAVRLGLATQELGKDDMVGQNAVPKGGWTVSV